MADDAFADLIRQVRAGDAQATVELLRRYEPAVRLEVRLRLRDPRLRRVLDSMDICQSVMGSFFARVAAGQFDLDEPEQLVKLLVTMSRNNVANHARRQHAQRRDQRRDRPLEGAADVAAPEPIPSDVVAARELLQEFQRRLSAEERQLAEMRSQGQSWEEIAAALGGTPQARRMQLSRAVDRVAGELGLEDTGNE